MGSGSSSAVSVCLVIHPISIVIQVNFLPSGDRTSPISLFNIVLSLPLKHQLPLGFTTGPESGALRLLGEGQRRPPLRSK